MARHFSLHSRHRDPQLIAFRLSGSAKRLGGRETCCTGKLSLELSVGVSKDTSRNSTSGEVTEGFAHPLDACHGVGHKDEIEVLGVRAQEPQLPSLMFRPRTVLKCAKHMSEYDDICSGGYEDWIKHCLDRDGKHLKSCRPQRPGRSHALKRSIRGPPGL
ncbi:hypothetical protein M9X92_012056 [Pyricularia oryzae]|nr:hypothetical protein M9X92_012056 [Pyricularia oryzae]